MAIFTDTTTTTATPASTDDVAGTLGQALINPIDNPEAFDYLELDDEKNPGIVVEIAGASSPRKWDERAGTGQSGATIVYSGDGLAKFTAKLLFWLAEHFQDWETFKAKLKSPTEKNPNALKFYHPYTDMLPVPVRSVVVTDVKAPVQSGDGFWTVEIAFLQYRAAKPAGAKPTSANKKPDEVDALIADLTKTMNDLAK